ncbi:MAG: acyl-CoA dehydrogenase [Gammaproteobacteria bacterium]|nr:acyl-CoA dehydrogenase [Gammaproteobacteria bacterium]
MSMIVNRRDLEFQLYEVLGIDSLFKSTRYASFDRELIDEMFNAAETLAEEVFLPFADQLDANEPRFENGTAVCIPEVKAALDAYAESGFFAAGFDADIGGLQMPYVAQAAMNGMFSAANGPVYGFVMLTTAAANMLNAFGSDEQKALYLPPMIEGRWFGTMCLSETQAGSSLSDIRTRAQPRGDGAYNITGTKMWISGGENNICENIVHMVLAKLTDASPGVKGISLFIVPKLRVDESGNVGEHNHIVLAGLNHKMGQRGIPNTLLNFGESGDCIGHLVGKPHEGLRYMFHMMNEARIAIGQGAVMSGLAGYLFSLDYAQHRPQGRHPQNKNPESPQIPIIEHADVRRMLLAQKASVEGGQALIFYCCLLVDQLKIETDSNERQRMHLLLELLTPIAKSWPSEFCLEANKLAIQVLGGYGYTHDYPVERFYRDNRLNPIHEGSHGIQGIDLLGRKVAMLNGEAFDVLLEEIRQTIASAGDEFAKEKQALQDALGALKTATAAALACTDISQRLANATLYLDACGHIVVAWLWLRQAVTASAKGSGIAADDAFYAGKQKAARYFFRYELPKVFATLDLIATLDRTVMDMAVPEFIGG